MIILPSNSVNSPVHLWGQLSPAKALQNWSAGTPIHDIYSMMLLDWIDITTDITACNRYHISLRYAGTALHTCKSPAKQVWNIEVLWFFVENLKYVFFSLTGVKCMFQESCDKSGWWFLKLQKNAISIPHCRKIESTCPPSSMETTIPRCPPLRGDSNSQRPLSPISDSNLLWSKLDLAEERDRRNWPNWLVVSNIWVYESGIYPESTPFNGH